MRRSVGAVILLTAAGIAAGAMCCAAIYDSASEAGPQYRLVNQSLGTKKSGSGRKVTRDVEVSDFNAIQTQTTIKVVYTPTSAGSEPKVRISAAEDFMDYLRVEVQNGTLQCFISNMSSHNVNGDEAEWTVYVEAPMVNSLGAYSCGSIDVQSDIRVQNLTADAASDGEIKFKNVTVTSGGTLKFTASSMGVMSVDELKIDNALDASLLAASMGELRINRLNGDNVSLQATSMGKVNLLNAAADVLRLQSYSMGEMNAHNLNVDELVCEAYTQGEMSVRGKADAVYMSASTEGSIDASGLKGVKEGNLTSYNEGKIRASSDIQNACVSTTQAGISRRSDRSSPSPRTHRVRITRETNGTTEETVTEEPDNNIRSTPFEP